MAFGVSSGPLINAGGALLFFLAGIVILAVAHRSRLGRRLGAFAVTFGLVYVFGNLVETNDPITAVAFIALGLVATVCLGRLILEVLRQVSPAARRRVAVLAIGAAVGAGVACAAFVALYLEEPGLLATDDDEGGLSIFPQVFLIEPLLLVLLAACAQAPLDGSLQHYKGRVMLGLAAGLFAVFIIFGAATTSQNQPGWAGLALEAVGLLLGGLAAFTAFLVLHGRPRGAERFARRTFAAIVFLGLFVCVGVAFAPEGDDPGPIDAIGPFGLLRTAGAVLLVLAVVKYDVLGVPLPRLVMRRGVLAGGALAVLFIVAQVAQNFLSAKYGLLMGGVLAGGFVFAASPIQRAIERSTERQKATAATSDAARAGYKAALRAAMRDGTLTRREERHLAEVALALGLSPVQSLDLRDEVEREGA